MACMRRAVGFALIAAAACGSIQRAPQRPRHPDDVGGDAVARNAACESCHREVASEWRASLHRASHSDADYQRAFSIEPLAFCTACHAPEAIPEAPEPARAALGVGCVTCHAPGTDARARACEGCHEFSFPDGTGKMQLTATEHRASAQATTACATCHMPGTGRHRDHRFAASREPAVLSRAATISAKRTTSGIVLRFEPREIGHAFPTGDIFRRLRVTVEPLGDPKARAEVHLSRKSKLGDDHDDRPFSDGRAREVEVSLAGGGRPLRWAVFYDRVAHPTSLDEASANVVASIELASGVLGEPGPPTALQGEGPDVR